MAQLLLGNLEEPISDEELGEFLTRYGFSQRSAIRRIPGAGARPTALVIFNDMPADGLRALQSRIHNMFWKNRKITALLLPERDET